jgi:hypothetical protein
MRLDRKTVGKWQRRFMALRLEGLRDDSLSGRPRTIEDTRIEVVIMRTLGTLLPEATRWNSRSQVGRGLK